MKTIIEKAIEELLSGGIVAIPTETVYGLAGNAYDVNAVKQIYDLKKRPPYNPLIVHLKSADELSKVAMDIPEAAHKLSQAFWPGPLTLILKKQKNIPDIVTSGLETVAVRVPNHPLALELLQKIPFPLAAPSANPFGSISPTSADHVHNYFSEHLDCIIDGGDCEKGIESTIVGFDSLGDPVVYRHGSISIEQLSLSTGKPKLFTDDDTKPNAPGMLSRHYAPATCSYLVEDVQKTMIKFSGKKIGLLLFNKKLPSNPLIHQEVLSETSNFQEAAKNLYAAMHRLDKKNLDAIIIERLPEKDLGITINDKLKRATKNKV